MKVFYLSKIKQLYFPTLIIILIGLTSCGTYQGAYSDDDGIYATRDRNVTTVVNSNQDDNYFAQKLQEYQNIDNSDLITDVDDYSYQDQNAVYESNNSNYGNSPWGYSNDVSVNIYSNSGFGFYGSPFYNNYWHTGYNYPYYNNWGFRNQWFNGYYGYNSFYNGFYGSPFYASYYGGFGNPYRNFYSRYYGRNNYGYSGYYRNYDSYGIRSAYNSRNNTTRRRVSSIANRSNNTISNRTNSSNRRTYNDTNRSRSVNESIQRSGRVQNTNRTYTNGSRTNSGSSTRRSTPTSARSSAPRTRSSSTTTGRSSTPKPRIRRIN